MRRVTPENEEEMKLLFAYCDVKMRLARESENHEKRA